MAVVGEGIGQGEDICEVNVADERERDADSEEVFARRTLVTEGKAAK